MSERNRRLVLAQRPSGIVDDSIVQLEEQDVPQPGPGQALARVRYLSIDPTIRTWMDDRVGYLPPIGLGEVIRSGGIAEVTESSCERYAPGDLVFGMTGWQDWVLADEGASAMQKLPAGVLADGGAQRVRDHRHDGVLRAIDVGRVKEGDVVVVSGAAGATGSMVGQIARIKGASTVVGIAGSADKCAWVVEELGFDAAINYKTDDVPDALRRACPNGIDLYFDNVGGDILNACLGQLALRGRVVLCGAIASYNDPSKLTGPANYINLLCAAGAWRVSSSSTTSIASPRRRPSWGAGWPRAK